MFLYKFFDYKYNISGFDSDLFSANHIIYIILGVIAATVVGIFSHKFDMKKFGIYLKIVTIFVILFEIAKISWESYYDITTGRGFNKDGLIPVYTCSLFIYTMILQSFGKGKIKDYSLSFLTTISMVSGLIGMIYCNGLNYYPFWTFGAFHSLIFHFLMFSTGLLMLTSGYKKLEWKDIYRGWVPMVILAFFAIPMNYEYGGDYMQLSRASGVPLYEDLAKTMSAHNLKWLFSMFMLVSYMILSSLVVSIYKLVIFLKNKKHNSASSQIECEAA